MNIDILATSGKFAVEVLGRAKSRRLTHPHHQIHRGGHRIDLRWRDVVTSEI